MFEITVNVFAWLLHREWKREASRPWWLRPYRHQNCFSRNSAKITGKSEMTCKFRIGRRGCGESRCAISSAAQCQTHFNKIFSKAIVKQKKPPLFNLANCNWFLLSYHFSNLDLDENDIIRLILSFSRKNGWMYSDNDSIKNRIFSYLNNRIFELIWRAQWCLL
jgi:hypothetical protein